MRDALIIGGGASGLAAAIRCAQAGVSFEWVDKHGSIGGIWDISHPDSPIYPSVRPITSRKMTGYVFAPMGAEGYPERHEMLTYLRTVAELYTGDLPPLIRDKILQVKLRRENENILWEAVFEYSGSRRYGAIIDASGMTNQPALDQGQLGAAQTHSSQYGLLGDLSGQKILVVGGGNSAFHIATDCAAKAEARLSLRRGYWLSPMFNDQVPTDHPLAMTARGNGLAEQLTLKNELRTSVESLYPFGYPKPDHLPLERGLVVCDEISAALRSGTLEFRPSINSIDGPRAHFSSGGVELFDQIVLATGYRPTLGSLIECLPDASSFSLHWLSKLYPMYFLVGTPVSDLGGFWVADLFAQLTASFLSLANRNLPEALDIYRRLSAATFDLYGGARLSQPRDGGQRVYGTALVAQVSSIIKTLGVELELDSVWQDAR